MTDTQLIFVAIGILLIGGWLSLKITTAAMKLVLYAVIIVVLLTMFRDKLPF